MIFIDLCTSEMHSRPTRAIATLRSRWRGASAALPSSCAATCLRKEGERKGTKNSAGALRSDTKADLLSSAPPPVMAETLHPNEETVTTGRQLMARQAGNRPPTRQGARDQESRRSRLSRCRLRHETKGQAIPRGRGVAAHSHPTPPPRRAARALGPRPRTRPLCSSC